jgi:hypothetical protein
VDLFIIGALCRSFHIQVLITLVALLHGLIGFIEPGVLLAMGRCAQ